MKEEVTSKQAAEEDVRVSCQHLIAAGLASVRR